MTSFDRLFRESKGRPVVHNGQTIHMFDRVEIPPSEVVSVVFESVASEWRQGISLTADGSFTVNGRQFKSPIVLWQDTAPPIVSVTVKSKSGTFDVKNVWDTGDGVVHSWHNGAAMIVECTQVGRRYQCNDGRADDDFDDLVFRIEFIAAAPPDQSGMPGRSTEGDEQV